jgi:hypothetical protein
MYNEDYDEENVNRNREALRRNNEELDRICNKICLVFGWCLVFGLFGYLIYAFWLVTGPEE